MPNDAMLGVDPSGVTLAGLPTQTLSVDVAFDEHRVWSIDVRSHDLSRPLAWPHSLRPYLTGSSTVTVTDSATGTEIVSEEVRFTPDEGRVRVVNTAGVPLSLNKWLRLAPSLTAIGEGIQELILTRSEEIIDELTKMGLRPFVVGGTLLGGVRDGALLPHDDDADIAYLSRHTNPFEVAREGYEVGRKLEALGYTLMRHSATHMQLHFRDDLDYADYYIDVFAAFFTDDGHINQPFHVRGKMREDQMLPFGSVTIGEHSFPAPRDAEAWLEINYDADWRTPIPGFEFFTPQGTKRRFENWFGSFDFGRAFWNAWYAKHPRTTPWEAGAEWISKNASYLQSSVAIELGAGDGRVSAMLATPHRKMVATDYAHTPLLLITKLKNPNITPMHVNLYRLASIATPFDAKIQGSFDVVANHVLDEIGHKGRWNALRLIRRALASGGSAIATVNTEPSIDVRFEDPTGWHLEIQELDRECALLGMSIETFPIASQKQSRRKPVGIHFLLSPSNVPRQHKEISVKQSLKQGLKRLLGPRGTQKKIAALELDIAALKEELDEYRSHSAKLAEIIDLAEDRLGKRGEGE